MIFKRLLGLPFFAKATCPKCKREINFVDNGHIEVNNYSKQTITIEGFWRIWSKCSNPNCEWSGIDTK